MSSRIYKLVPYGNKNSYDNYFLCRVPADVSIESVMHNILNDINTENIAVRNESLLRELLAYRGSLHYLRQTPNSTFGDFDASRVVFTI